MNNRPLLSATSALSEEKLLRGRGRSYYEVKAYLELGSSRNNEESIVCFFLCIPLKELLEFCGGR